MDAFKDSSVEDDAVGSEADMAEKEVSASAHVAKSGYLSLWSQVRVTACARIFMRPQAETKSTDLMAIGVISRCEPVNKLFYR